MDKRHIFIWDVSCVEYHYLVDATIAICYNGGMDDFWMTTIEGQHHENGLDLDSIIGELVKMVDDVGGWQIQVFKDPNFLYTTQIPYQTPFVDST